MAALFYPLYYNIVTTSKAAMSKVLGPNEVGKAFGLLGSFDVSLTNGVMYQATLWFCPQFYMYLSSSLYLLGLAIACTVYFKVQRPRLKIIIETTCLVIERVLSHSKMLGNPNLNLVSNLLLV